VKIRFVGALLAAVVMVVWLGTPSQAGTKLELVPIGTFDSGVGEGGSEIAKYDGWTRQMFVTNGAEDRIDVVDVRDPAHMKLVRTIDLTEFGPSITSVDVIRGLGVATVVGSPATEPGTAVFFSPTTGRILFSRQVGPLPDMVTFAGNGSAVLVANEGEPRCIDASGDVVTDPTEAVNPQGSVSIIRIVDGVPGQATNVGFTSLDSSTSELQADGVRVPIWPGANPSQDFEPEFITVSGRYAYVTLQEANSVAIVDWVSAELVGVKGLGLKSWEKSWIGFDASDRDDSYTTTIWPVQNMYMPDAIASMRVGGKTYLVTANEGDGVEYFAGPVSDDEDQELCYTDEARVKDLPLDPSVFVDGIGDDDKLGRLKVTTSYPSVKGEDGYTRLAAYGGRSFTVWDTSGNVVFDSGSGLEAIIRASITEEEWLENHDGRSDDKGPEPEGVAVGAPYGMPTIFVGLERSGGIMVFDASDPSSPDFVQWARTADVSPEGLQYVPAYASVTGKPLLIVSYEISGTTTVFEIRR
jgi:hypothetical protein